MEISAHTPPAPGSVVVGLDGSPGSRAALGWGVEQARLEKRPLALIAVMAEWIYTWAGEPALDIPAILDSIHRDCEALLTEAVTSLTTGDRPGDDDLVVHAQVVRGDAREVMSALSAEAATIVLGSRGRGPLASLLLGSVSVGVMEHARCPVVIVRPEDGGTRTRTERVLVGVYHGRPVGHTAEFAFRQAAERGLPLTALHGPWQVLYGYTDVGPTDSTTPAQDEAEAMARVADLRAKFPEVDVTFAAAPGLPDAYLVKESRGGDLVVVGTHHPDLLTTIFDGDIARAVTEHARCLVAVVPET